MLQEQNAVIIEKKTGDVSRDNTVTIIMLSLMSRVRKKKAPNGKILHFLWEAGIIFTK